MNAHQKHIYRLTMEAAKKLREAQLYSRGRGAGHTSPLVEWIIATTLTNAWQAAREIENATPVRKLNDGNGMDLN